MSYYMCGVCGKQVKPTDKVTLMGREGRTGRICHKKCYPEGEELKGE